MEEQNQIQQLNTKKIPWYMNFKWYHTLLLSFIFLALYFITNIGLFDWGFLVGFIFSIVQIVKTIKNRKKSI